MDTLFRVIVVLQVVSALIIIGLVLLQHGKGADMGAAFGSGASGSLFGASGSSNFVSKSTGVAAAIFFACTLALAYMASNRHASSQDGSVMDSLPGTKASAAASAAAPASAPAASAGATPAASSAASAAAAAPAAAAPAAAASAAASVASPAASTPANQVPK